MNTTQTLQFQDYDAIVVGARVAGASTAMLLARRGLSRWGLLPRLQEEDTGCDPSSSRLDLACTDDHCAG